MAKKKSRFAGRTARSMEKSKNAYGYLKLPENINMFKPEGGTEIVIDIVPYIVTDSEHMDGKKYADDAVVGDQWWKRPIRVHRDVGPDGVSIICPTTVGKKCPICEYGSKRRKEGAEWEELKDIFPKNRTIFYVVPLDARECDVDYTEGEVHVMDYSDHNFLDTLNEEIKRDIDNEIFPDVDEGLSIQIYWRDKKLGKIKYAEASKIDFVDRDEQYGDDFVNDLTSLDDIMEIKEYKEIEALYYGMENMEDEDVDTAEVKDEPAEEKPRRQRKTTRPTRNTRSAVTARKPKEEEPVDVEEEPVEEKPRRRKPSTRKPKEEEPVDVIEDAEIVEDEPKKKGTRTRKPTRKPAEEENKCPFGHEFGVDTDEFDDCDKCKVWEDCKEEKGD